MKHITTIRVESPSFTDQGWIPQKHTGYGEDISPAFQLFGVSEQGVSLVVILVDLDVPFHKEYPHWLIWNIPKMEQIPEGIPHGAILPEFGNACQGMAYGKNCYRGPKPPVFLPNPHQYVFRFFVLDCFLDLPSSAKKRELFKAMQGHILQQGSICGTYKYQRSQP